MWRSLRILLHSSGERVAQGRWPGPERITMRDRDQERGAELLGEHLVHRRQQQSRGIEAIAAAQEYQRSFGNVDAQEPSPRRARREIAYRKLDCLIGVDGPGRELALTQIASAILVRDHQRQLQNAAQDWAKRQRRPDTGTE